MAGQALPTGVAVSPLIQAMVVRMRSESAERLFQMERVLKVREGRFNEVWPEKFADDFPTQITANFVDIAARDMVANLCTLPSLACSAGSMRSDADRRRAERKNRIAGNYWRYSDLSIRMVDAADRYLTYGFVPFLLEPCYDEKMPRIRVEDSLGSYYDLDRDGNCVRYMRVWREHAAKLAAMFPNCSAQILTDDQGNNILDIANTTYEVVRYVDKDVVLTYLPECKNLVLAGYQHGFNFTPVVIAERNKIGRNARGAFDDVLWVQLAHSIMAALSLEAGSKAVQAPIALPDDVQQLSIGPDAVIQTADPDKVKRVALEVPASAFALSQQLQDEMHQGAGYPDTRLGIGPAGGSTGRGISALEGGYDTQIRLGQEILGRALRKVTEMCFKAEMILWPNKAKTIAGTVSGESFEITYIPRRDIGDDTTVDVSYGYASGLSPNAAIVTLLQLMAADLVSKDDVRRNLPFDVDIDQVKRELLEQKMTDWVLQGLAASLQATGQMMAQGQNAEALQLYKTAVGVITGARKGDDIAKIITDNLISPAEQAEEAAEQQQQQAMQAMQAAQGGAAGGGGAGAGGGDALDGVGPDGLSQGVAPGQAGMAPGGRPSVADVAASFSPSGSPTMSYGLRKRVATGV